MDFSLFSRVQLSISQHLVQSMAWHSKVTSHYLKQCWPISIKPHGIARPQCVKHSLLLLQGSSGPEDGVFVFGLYLDGAQWDLETLTLADSLPGNRFCRLPEIHFKPSTVGVWLKVAASWDIYTLLFIKIWMIKKIVLYLNGDITELNNFIKVVQFSFISSHIKYGFLNQ